MKNLLLSLFSLAAVGLISGCASTGFLKAYPGPERPADQLATIVLPASIEVRNINGAKQPGITSTLLKPVYIIATLPGPQDWSIRYYAPLAGGYDDQRNEVTESPWIQFPFKAEAGGVYHLNVETPREKPGLRNEKDKVRFSIVAGAKAVNVVRPSATPPEPASVSRAAPVQPPPALVPKVEAPQTLESAALMQLKKWWGVAGPDEQRAFRDWLKAQP
jgi:hypothetical protein